MVATASHSVTIVLWKETAFPLITAALCNTASNYIFALWFVSSSSFFFMVALCNTTDHHSFALRFLFLSFFSSSNLSGRRLDVYHTSTHGVALVRIYNACLKCAARSLLEIQDAKIAILAPSHNYVGLYLHS